MSSIMILISSRTGAPGMILPSLFSDLFGRLFGREMLWHKILCAARNTVFVSPTMHHGFGSTKIIQRSWRRRAPFQRRGMPWILFVVFRAPPDTPKKVKKKNTLRRDSHDRGARDEIAHRRAGHGGRHRISAHCARMSDQPEPVHRHE